MITIYHNPRCSKSRATLGLLHERGLEPNIVLYLEDPPDVGTLEELTGLLGCSIADIVRTGESRYAELGLKDRTVTDSELMALVSRNPILLERPIVVSGNRAAVGRPPENVLEII